MAADAERVERVTWHATDILAALLALDWSGHNELSVGDLEWLAGRLAERLAERAGPMR